MASTPPTATPTTAVMREVDRFIHEVASPTPHRCSLSLSNPLAEIGSKLQFAGQKCRHCNLQTCSLANGHVMSDADTQT